MQVDTPGRDTWSKTTAPGRFDDSSSRVPPEGTVLGGRYRIQRLIGIGGMGVVLAAHDLEADRRVALKCLAREALEDDELCQRFQREAQAFARVRGEHIARIFDVGTTDDGRPYLVLEYLEGRDLARFLARGTPLPLSDVARWIVEACEGLADAHAANIVHRDIKPANLFLAERPDGSSSIKVLDFGISKLTDDPMTRTKTMLGTAIYMSPEQLRSSRNVDHRADIWALGVVLYELLTGAVPFSGANVPAIIDRVNENHPKPVTALRPTLPAELGAIVGRCLRTRPEERYSSALDLAADLRPFLTHEDEERMPESLGALAVWPRPPTESSRSSGPHAIPIRRTPKERSRRKHVRPRKRQRQAARPEPPREEIGPSFYINVALATLAVIFVLAILRG